MDELHKCEVTIWAVQEGAADGPPLCWRTLYGHGRADTANEAMAAAYLDRAEWVRASYESTQARAIGYRQTAEAFESAALKMTIGEPLRKPADAEPRPVGCYYEQPEPGQG